MGGKKYQTYGSLYYYDGKLTDKAPPEAFEEWKKAQEEERKATESRLKAQKAADEKRMQELRRRNEQFEHDALRSNLQDSEWDAIKADWEAAEAHLKDIEAVGALNQTLASARKWLVADEVAGIGVFAIAGGWLAELGAGVAEAYEAIRIKHVIEGVHHASEAYHAYEAGHAVISPEGFPQIADQMSAEQIREYGDEVQRMTGLEEAQVRAEGREKLRHQFDDAAKAREEREAADEKAREAHEKHEAAKKAAAAKGVFVAH